MDISQASKEPLPSYGQHKDSLEETATCHRCQASPHPISEQFRLHQQKQSKSVSPTIRMKRTQEGEASPNTRYESF
uniref:Uncharacterized protein n=1 Tax=Oryza glaberrima TaxID=4538 RepID=I1QDG7_ORYGL